MKAKVYSYTRFSSKEQALGDSERRQIELAKRYAVENGLILDEGLIMVDRGLSGYHGTHRKKGAFGLFLQKVQSGEVPIGSVLLVENMDRLGREDVLTAFETVSSLLRAGITIKTLSPVDTFTTESVNTGGIWRLVTYITMSNAESAKKAERLKASWQNRRKLANKDALLTGKCPAWLKIDVQKNSRGLVVSRTVKVIPEAAETIKRIFQMKLEGFGTNAIERKLNTDSTWVPRQFRKSRTEGWRSSYIEKILRTRAVLGEFQPHHIIEVGSGDTKKRQRVPVGEAIQNYFPAIIPSHIFHAVQRRLKANKCKGGRTGKAFNVLKHLVICGYCGGPMTYVDKGDSKKGGKYLMCDTGRRGVLNENAVPKCKSHSVLYAEVLETVLNNCSRLKPEVLLPTSKEQTVQGKSLRTRFNGLSAEAANVEEQIENFIDQIGRTASAERRAQYEKRIEALEERKAEIQKDILQVQDVLRRLEQGAQVFQEWQKNIEGLKQAILKDVDSRIKLNTHLKELITKVEVFAKGHADTIETIEETIEESMPNLAQAESYNSFRKYISQRVLSKEGRFWRLYFKHWRTPTKREQEKGFSIRIAPENSLAGRMEINGKGRTFHRPALGKLLQEFYDARKQGFVAKSSVLGHLK